MEARINYHIRGIFMLNKKAIPSTLKKHLTNNIFNKPNKEAMEHVLYYLLPLVVPNCLKNAPWPITTPKEAAEFRNAVTHNINNLNGFIYEKSSNVVGKVNSSLLANPGGPIFVFFMYQLCIFIKLCELKKKGIFVLNPPLYVEDEYIDQKIAMFSGISESNFNEINEIISQLDFDLQNTTELAIKYKEISLESKQRIKDLKSELLNIEHCEATDNDVSQLKQKYTQLYDDFKQNELIAIVCAKLADIILKNPESWDANLINLISIIDKEELTGSNGKIDLVKLLTAIKHSLRDFIKWCEQLNDEEKLYGQVLEIQQLVTEKTEQLHTYEQVMKNQNVIIDHLETENKDLDLKIFNSKTLEYIDPKVLSFCKPISPIILKTDLIDKPRRSMAFNDNKKSRRSISLHCSNKQYDVYQKLSIGVIKEAREAILAYENEIDSKNDIHENIIDNLSTSYKSNLTNEGTSIQTDNENEHLQDEINSVSISRRSIENLKQKFIKIKKGQTMHTIPHSPLSPF